MELTRYELEGMMYDPARVQSRILNYIEQATDGEMVITDPTNPVTMLLEAAVTTSTAATVECSRLLRKKYPNLALTAEELMHHLSDDELANMFAIPAECPMLFYVNIMDMRMNGFRAEGSDYWETIIPVGTVVSVATTKLTLLNDISVKLYDNGTVAVEQKISNNDIAIEDLGMLPAKIITDENGIPFIMFATRMKQITMATYTPSVTTGKGFIETYKLTDKYCYIEVFSKLGNGNYRKLEIAYNEEYINPSQPTAYIMPTGRDVKIKIPDVYLLNNMVGGSLVINVYETQGKLYLPIKEYLFNQYNLTLGNTGSSIQASTSQNIAIKVNSNSIIDGGSDGMTATALRESIIYNSTGDIDLPITDWQISRMGKMQGYDIFRQQDVITNRLYAAVKNIAKINNPSIKANQELFFNTTSVLLRDALKSNTVVEYKDTFVIMSNTVFKEENSVITIVDNDERKLVNRLTGEDLINRLRKTKYFYTPFYYVVDKENGYTYSKVYHLDSPQITTNRIVNKNVAVKPSVNIKARDIVRSGNQSYKLAVTLTGNNEYGELDKDKLHIQVAIPLKGDVYAYIDMEYNPTKDQYEVELRHNLDIDNGDYMTLVNGRSTLADKRFNLQSILTFYIYTTDQNIISNHPFLTNEVNITNNHYVVFTKETMNVTFGTKLDYIWSRLNNTYTDRKYLTYEKDIYQVYEKDEYRTNPETGSIFFIENGKIKVYKTHEAGEFVLDDKGEKIVIHAKSDTILDEYGRPTIDVYSGLERFIDIAMLEAEFKFATNLAYRNYSDMTLDRILQYILADMPVFNDKLIENTSILYKSYKTAVPINTIINNSVVSMHYAISPKITLYSSSQIAYTVEQIANFRNTIGLIIDEYLNNSRLSMTELRNTIVAALGGDIVGAKISGIDTNDSEIVVVNDKINRLTLAKRLNINDFNEFEVIYDVDVVIQYV